MFILAASDCRMLPQLLLFEIVQNRVKKSFFTPIVCANSNAEKEKPARVKIVNSMVLSSKGI